MVRSNLFDFAWNIRAAVDGNQMTDHGHFCPWLVDALDQVCKGWLDEGNDARPVALRGHRRTDTTVAPITVRGIDWEQLQRLKSLGARAMEPSVLRTEAEVQKVLAYPLLVVRGDAAGIARATGIVTTTKRLQQLARRIAVETRARQLLSLHGERALQARVRVTDGGRAPRQVADPPSLRPAPPDAPNGPLPFDQVRLPAEERGATIEEAGEGEDVDEGDRNGGFDVQDEGGGGSEAEEASEEKEEESDGDGDGEGGAARAMPPSHTRLTSPIHEVGAQIGGAGGAGRGGRGGRGGQHRGGRAAFDWQLPADASEELVQRFNKINADFADDSMPPIGNAARARWLNQRRQRRALWRRRYAEESAGLAQEQYYEAVRAKARRKRRHDEEAEGVAHADGGGAGGRAVRRAARSMWDLFGGR